MDKESLNGVQACVFDAYGTLFDFAVAARSCRDVLGDAFDKLTILWRDKQLQYTWLRAAHHGSYEPRLRNRTAFHRRRTRRLARR